MFWTGQDSPSQSKFFVKSRQSKTLQISTSFVRLFFLCMSCPGLGRILPSPKHVFPKSKKSSKIHATSKHYSALANTARSPDKRLREPTGSVDQHGLAVVEDSSSCRSDSEPDMSMPGCPAIADSGAMIGTKSSTVVYAAMIGKERSASLLADTSDDDDSDGGGVSSL